MACYYLAISGLDVLQGIADQKKGKEKELLGIEQTSSIIKACFIVYTFEICS